MAKKITLDVEFERTDDTAKRLPTRADMRAWMTAALSVPAAFCVRFVGEEEGRELNKTYRSKDYATNVLTFDYQHEPEAQADIVICTSVLVREAKEQENPAQFLAEKEAEYTKLFANPYNAAKYGYIDDVIEPRNTRFRIIRALQQLQTKKLTNPAKKHGNIPL